MKKRGLYILIFTLFFFSFYACEKDENKDAETEVIDKQFFLNLVNKLREGGCNCGDTYMEPVAPLKWDNELERAAKAHSIDMNTQNYFSHVSKNGDRFTDRIKKTNYQGKGTGENIARNYSDEKAVFNAWRESPGHCKNMMSARSTDIGVGKSGAYWTMVLGTK